MTSSKWVAVVPAYLAVYAGLFLFHSAWAGLIGFHLGMLMTIIILRPDIQIKLLFKTNHYQWMFPGILLCGVSGILIYYLYPLLGKPEVLASQLAGLGLEKGTWLAFIAYFTLINPFIEEYFWRACLGSDTKGFYFGDLFYAGYHGLVLAGRVPVLVFFLALISLVFIGWLWRQIGREDGGLLIPVAGHMAADLSVMASVYLLIN